MARRATRRGPIVATSGGMKRFLSLLLMCSVLAACGGDTTGTVEPTATMGGQVAGAAATESGQPTVTPEAPATPALLAPTPTFVPTPAPAGSGQTPAGGAAPPAPATAPPVEKTGAATTLRLEDTVWSGGWRNSGGSVYGGRTATWIYGRDTAYHTMQTTFELATAPRNPAQLAVEGMDDENGAKADIEITVNGAPIYGGPNPLPNDDPPLESGTWATYLFPFDAALLRSGTNTITIRNRSPGAFGRPPFFMLDFADLAFAAP